MRRRFGAILKSWLPVTCSGGRMAVDSAQDMTAHTSAVSITMARSKSAAPVRTGLTTTGRSPNLTTCGTSPSSTAEPDGSIQVNPALCERDDTPSVLNDAAARYVLWLLARTNARVTV